MTFFGIERLRYFGSALSDRLRCGGSAQVLYRRAGKLYKSCYYALLTPKSQYVTSLAFHKRQDVHRDETLHEIPRLLDDAMLPGEDATVPR